MEWREKLKGFPIFYSANEIIKAYGLKSGLKRLNQYYRSQCDKYEVEYNESNAISQFIDRHKKLSPLFSKKQIGELNIFWVGASKPQDESGFLQSLSRFGNVHIYNNNPIENYGPIYASQDIHWLAARKLNDEALLKQVSLAHKQNNIDFLIGQMWAHCYSSDVLMKVRSLGIPIINIAMDDRLPIHWSTNKGYRMGSVGLGKGVDIVLTTASETCEWYAFEQMPSIFWPLASDAELFNSNSDEEKNIDILFIGNRYGIRGKIIDYLSKKGLQVTCYGNGWPNGPVNAEENTNFSKKAKIILGVSTVGYSKDVYTLKLRDFDSLMSGALYITHRNPDLLKIFSEGVHLECYETLDELYKKIIYYLANDERRIKIANQGRDLAIGKHTWDIRLTNTFTQLGFIDS